MSVIFSRGRRAEPASSELTKNRWEIREGQSRVALMQTDARTGFIKFPGRMSTTGTFAAVGELRKP